MWKEKKRDADGRRCDAVVAADTSCSRHLQRMRFAVCSTCQAKTADYPKGALSIGKEIAAFRPRLSLRALCILSRKIFGEIARSFRRLSAEKCSRRVMPACRQSRWRSARRRRRIAAVYFGFFAAYGGTGKRRNRHRGAQVACQFDWDSGRQKSVSDQEDGASDAADDAAKAAVILVRRAAPRRRRGV